MQGVAIARNWPASEHASSLLLRVRLGASRSHYPAVFALCERPEPALTRRRCTVVLVCSECGEVDDFERGWVAQMASSDQDPEEGLVVLCPACAER